MTSLVLHLNGVRYDLAPIYDVGELKASLDAAVDSIALTIGDGMLVEAAIPPETTWVIVET